MIKSLKTLRFQNWWIAKIPPLLSYGYACIFLLPWEFENGVKTLFLLVVWMIGAAAFGHYINDVFDLKDDLQAGKENRTKDHSTAIKVAVSLGLLLLALLPWIKLPFNPYNLGLVGIQILIFLIYSAPPFRLKERGILSVIADACYAHVIPGLVVVITFMSPEQIRKSMSLLLLFAGWQFIIGCRNILNHHIDDYENDMRSNTVTTATIYGDTAIKKVVKRIFFPLEVVVMLILFSALPWPFGYLVYFYLGYIVFTFYREVTFLKEKLLGQDVVIVGRYDYLCGILLNEFYEKWLPLILLVWLSIRDGLYWILLGVHIVLFYKIIITFKKDISFIIYLFYEIVRQAFFGIQKPVKHFFLSIVPTIRNMSYWKIRIFFVRTSMGIFWFIKRNTIRTYWRITVFFRRTYWAWMRLYRDHIVRIAWNIAKFYYRVEYALWKRFYKPIKDRRKQKQADSGK